VAVDIIVFRDVTPCRPVDKRRRFSKSCCVFIQIKAERGSVVFFFFFNRRYNPWWVLACFTISFHNLLSLHISLQFLTFIFFRSSSTWSCHLSLGLPTGLDEHGSHLVTFLTIFVVSILITCAAHLNLCDFINLSIIFFN